MSRGGLKPETIAQKQVERADLGRQCCRMKRCGSTYREIGEKLGCSHEQARILVNEGIESYRDEGRENAAAMIEGMIADLLKSSQELWIQWERSKQDKGRITTRTPPPKKGQRKGKPEVRETVEGRLGDPRYMAEFRANMRTIAELRGVLSVGDDSNAFEEYDAEMEGSFEPPPKTSEKTA